MMMTIPSLAKKKIWKAWISFNPHPASGIITLASRTRFCAHSVWYFCRVALIFVYSICRVSECICPRIVCTCATTKNLGNHKLSSFLIVNIERLKTPSCVKATRPRSTGTDTMLQDTNNVSSISKLSALCATLASLFHKS